MKEILATVRNALIALGYFRLVDVSEGQLGTESFALFPCALIDITSADWQGGDDNHQVGMLDFSVEYAWRKLEGVSNLKSTKSYNAVAGRWTIVSASSKDLTGRFGTTHGTIARTRTERKDHKDFWIVKESYHCTVAEALV